MRSSAGRTAVITGAGSGIGRALAEELARGGARLALSDIHLDAVEETAERCRRLGARAEAYALDVADRAAVFAHADEVAGAFGGVHLVVNNAGVALHGAVRDLAEPDMRWLMEIDYWGVVHGTQAFLPHLVASGSGRLANISSVFGLIAVPDQAAYNAAKFAVRGFTEALRQEMQRDRLPVSVSTVHPGGIRTAIARSARYSSPSAREGSTELFARVARTSPERAARVILRGVERRRARILVGPDAWALAALPRALGAHYGRVVVPSVRRLAP